jgi:hypothetical protein
LLGRFRWRPLLSSPSTSGEATRVTTPPPCLFATTAHTEQLPVLTATVDEFDRVDEIDVLDWSYGVIEQFTYPFYDYTPTDQYARVPPSQFTGVRMKSIPCE